MHQGTTTLRCTNLYCALVMLFKFLWKSLHVYIGIENPLTWNFCRHVRGGWLLDLRQFEAFKCYWNIWCSLNSHALETLMIIMALETFWVRISASILQTHDHSESCDLRHYLHIAQICNLKSQPSADSLSPPKVPRQSSYSQHFGSSSLHQGQ